MDSIRVIGEPRRRKILSLVWDEELPAGEIAQRFDITFGAVSQHLAVLREAGMVRVRREGTKRLYRADKDALGPFRQMLETMWESKLDDLARAVEEGR